jgi:hypothetical protein
MAEYAHIINGSTRPASDCPDWCRGWHPSGGGEHVSAEAQLGDVLMEVIQFPGDEQVYVSLLEFNEGGQVVTLPMTVVPLIATTVLRLMSTSVLRSDVGSKDD